MKKKLLALILALAMAMSMAACGGGNNNENSADNSADDAVTESEEVAEETENVAKDEGTLGEYGVKINDCKFGKDYDGKKVIVISYDFTNNSDDSIAADFALSTKAFQNGIELESAYFLKDDWYDGSQDSKEIKPGTTITDCQEAFVLADNSDVEFEVAELISFNDETLTKTFSIE